MVPTHQDVLGRSVIMGALAVGDKQKCGLCPASSTQTQVCMLETEGIPARPVTTGCLISPGGQASSMPEWEEKGYSSFAA